MDEFYKWIGDITENEIRAVEKGIALDLHNYQQELLNKMNEAMQQFKNEHGLCNEDNANLKLPEEEIKFKIQSLEEE